MVRPSTICGSGSVPKPMRTRPVTKAQVRAYAFAVERLVGQLPVCRLCFLNAGGEVVLHEVDGGVAGWVR